MTEGTDGRILKFGDHAIVPFTIGDEDWGAIGDDGKRLPVYSIEAGGSGRMTIGCGAGRAYTIGDSVGRYAIAGVVHKASEEAVG
jgi:hypothetical protein